MNKKNKGNTLKYLALITQLGINSITPVILGVLLGNYLDSKFDFKGVFSIIFLVLGGATAVFNIYKLARPKKKE